MRDFTGVSGATDDGQAKVTPAPATRWTPEVANAIVQELKKVITDPTGGNVALDPGDNGQLLAAIRHMFLSAFPVTSNAYGHAIDCGTFKVQMGLVEVVATGSSNATFDITFPVPFGAAAWHCSGNSTEGARGGWNAMTVVVPYLTDTGASGIADAANSTQAIIGGRYIRWIAVGPS